MAGKFPYISSGGPLTQVFSQLRKSFPSVVDAPLLKKLGIAPNNESYVINILRFLDLIDEDGNKNLNNSRIFLAHKDEEFQSGLGELVEASYKEMFEVHGPDAWSVDMDSLITFFRNSDQTSDIVGRRQASTYVTLCVLAGKRQAAAQRQANGVSKGSAKGDASKSAKSRKQPAKPSKGISESPIMTTPPNEENIREPSGVALTVRIEINLPTQGDQGTYDRIFKSIKENLINGK